MNFSGAKPDNKKATTEQPDAEKCVDENNVGNCEIRKDEVVSEHLDKGLKFKIALWRGMLKNCQVMTLDIRTFFYDK